MKKVIVFWPMSNANPPDEFFISYQATKNHLLRSGLDIRISEFPEKKFPISANRNMCVGRALERIDCDITIWLDTDMDFPEDCLFRLLEPDLKIVSGMYYLKKEPYSPMAFLRRDYDEDNDMWVYDPYWGYPLNTVFVCDMVGMGCVRLDTEVLRNVFRKYGAPLFKYRSHTMKELAGGGEEKRKALEFYIKYGVEFNTEESYFWPKVRDYGYDIYVDPHIQCGHWTKRRIGLDDYLNNYNRKYVDKSLETANRRFNERKED